MAFVVAEATAEELSSYLSLRIAKFELPGQFVFVDAMPRTPYGKVEKAKLRERLP